MDQNKVKTTIEKTMHGLVREIKEHIYDYTILTIKKQNPNFDRQLTVAILEIVQKGIDDGFMSKIDRYNKKIDETLNEVFENETPK